MSLLGSRVYFLLPGDQEVGKKVKVLGKAEVDWKIFFFFYLFKSAKN